MLFKRIVTTILFSMLISLSWGQPQPQNPPEGDPDKVPLTGVEYLALAGVAYGIKRFSKRKNKINNEA